MCVHTHAYRDVHVAVRGQCVVAGSLTAYQPRGLNSGHHVCLQVLSSMSLLVDPRFDALDKNEYEHPFH